MEKPIDFGKSNDKDMLFQIGINDKGLNGIFEMVSDKFEDKWFSTRNLLKKGKRFDMAQTVEDMMNTQKLEKAFPDLAEKYGDSELDILFSPSHKLFQSGMPKAKMSGIYFLKNDVVKV